MRDRRMIWFVAAVMLLIVAGLPSHAPAANGTWIGTASGTWSDTGNWASGIVADGATFTGDLSTVDLTSDITVTIDSTRRTVAILNLGDTVESNSYIIAASGGATLLLDNFGSDAQLNQTATSHGDTLDGSLSALLGSNLTTTNASANALTVNSNISATFAGARSSRTRAPAPARSSSAAIFRRHGANLRGAEQPHLPADHVRHEHVYRLDNDHRRRSASVLPTSSLSFNSGNDNNLAILEASGTFTRDIGKHQGNVFWNQRGGFAASGGDLTVTLNGGWRSVGATTKSGSTARH